MFKKQLDTLTAVLTRCNELSGRSDSLTNTDNNKIFAGLALNNDYCCLELFTRDEEGVSVRIIGIDLDDLEWSLEQLKIPELEVRHEND